MILNRTSTPFCAGFCRRTFPTFRLRTRAGFTLIELMIVIFLLAVVVAFALPSFDATLKRYRVGMAARQIASVLQFARIEAIRSRTNVIVLQTTAPVECTNGPATDWHCGIDVQDPSNTPPNPATLKTISASSLATVNVQMKEADTNGKNLITFSPLGFAAGCATCNGVAANDSFIHVWPSALGHDPSTVTATLVNTICTSRAGMVLVVPRFVDTLAQCA